MNVPSPNVPGTDFGYTFQRNLPDTGLMDYRARMYSSALGRFIQPDTVIPSPANPQSWNRFSYVNNNPVRYNDPTGHRNCEEDGYNCGKHVIDPSQGISQAPGKQACDKI
jgi:RHS repeat-associated protein